MYVEVNFSTYNPLYICFLLKMLATINNTLYTAFLYHGTEHFVLTLAIKLISWMKYKVKNEKNLISLTLNILFGWHIFWLNQQRKHAHM